MKRGRQSSKMIILANTPRIIQLAVLLFGGLLLGWIILSSAPFLQLKTKSTASILKALANSRNLQKENDSLKEQIAEYESILRQNKTSKDQLALIQRELGSLPQSKKVMASVVQYQSDNFRQFLTINKGEANGLKKGQAVVSADRLLGRISAVSKSTATVRLVGDTNSRVSGLVLPYKALGTVQGQIGASLLMDNVLASDEIRQGDVVITSGLGGGVPAGLKIGVVKKIDKQTGGIFQRAWIDGAVSPRELSVVSVVLL